MTTPTVDLPPPRGPRGLAYRTALEGQAAGLGELEPSDCPYSPARAFSRRAWLAGYVLGREQSGRPVETPTE